MGRMAALCVLLAVLCVIQAATVVDNSAAAQFLRGYTARPDATALPSGLIYKVQHCLSVLTHCQFTSLNRSI